MIQAFSQFLQTFHFTGLLFYRSSFNYSDYTDFMRGQLTKGQNWKQSRRLCQNSSEGDLESIEEENEQIFVESIIKNLTAVKYFARARASFPFHYIYHEFHQRCNTSVSAKQSIVHKEARFISGEISLYFSRGRMLWKVMSNEDYAPKTGLLPYEKHRCINFHYLRVFRWVTNVLETNMLSKLCCSGFQI